MLNLSIPMTRQDSQINRFAWAVRLSPLLVAIILGALWIVGAPSPVPDLRLSAPVVARPGSTIGLRAWHLDEDEEGRTVVAAPPVRVELRNAAGIRLAETSLTESQVHGREGQLSIPEGLDEALSLVALAEVAGVEVSVERTLYVQDSIESRLPKGRAVNAFQLYQLGPMRVSDPRRPAPVLDPRLEEGACVPGLRCWLSVWVGHEDTRVRLRALTGVRLESEALTPSNGFARFPVVVQGSEARIEVEALAPDGTLLGARELRLPLVPGGVVARASVEGSRIRLDWEQLGEKGPVLVDVFEGRRWVGASSLSPDAPYLSVPGPGVCRLQVRRDLFSDNTAGVSYVVIANSNQRGRAHAAAEAVLADADREGLDPLALAVVDGALPAPATEDAIRALFAVPSFDVISLGPGMSSRVGVDQALELEQELRRWQAAAVIFLIGLIVSMVLLRVELLGQARARQVLDELGDGAESSTRTPSSGRGLWAFVLLIFVLMAVLALSKRWF